MNTRAKFICRTVEMNPPASSTYMVKLDPVIGGSEENRTFFKYTPGGQITLSVLGSDTAGQFQEGYEYYVDFSRVEQ